MKTRIMSQFSTHDVIYQIDENNSSTDCLEPSLRIDLMKDWSCDEIAQFETLKDVYITYTFIVNGIQAMVFLFLMILLTYLRCKGEG